MMQGCTYTRDINDNTQTDNLEPEIEDSLCEVISSSIFDRHKSEFYQSCELKKETFDNNTIVEIKTSINKNLDDLIELFPFQRVRFSKYCFAADSLKQTG